MADRSVSWTDPESVARLLARATAPRRVAATLSRVTAAARAVRAPATPPARASVPAPAAAPVPAPPPVAAPPAPLIVPALEHVSDNPSDRLDALMAWTLDHQRCTGAFVADDNGLTLAAHGISEAHVALVGPLLSALLGVRSIPGVDATAGALWLGTNMMSWVETRTERGGFCLGTVGAEALSTEALNQLKEALEVTVRGL
ncbi:MAG: hypothetical protein EOO73_02685 [Myxococcales bacterium]|nr:MAG: hypothetical protein EOO73_02685 [Myxococcales bacterium]